LASKLIPVSRALALELSRLGAPVVLRYELARITWQLYRARNFEGQPISLRRETLDAPAFSRTERGLLDAGVLVVLAAVRGRSAYGLVGANLNDRNAIICTLDPFCYLSHLSAMEFHGLTDRMPEQIYISTPVGKDWTVSALERMQRDLGGDFAAFHNSGLPQLRRATVAKIGQRPIHRFGSLHGGAFRAIKDTGVRVSTLGRTFLDMLREPGLCGGISHVLQVYAQHAALHRRLIFDEIDQHGGPIDKVRAGYIFEDICHVQDPRIEAWLAFAARGGSRKLDASADYEPTFSERWMLSINTVMPEAVT
jgi:predicted transcriptional regulator of viral defense system